MKIRRPRSLTGIQIGIGIFVGVLSGVYIWKPVFTTEAQKPTASTK